MADTRCLQALPTRPHNLTRRGQASRKENRKSILFYYRSLWLEESRLTPGRLGKGPSCSSSLCRMFSLHDGLEGRKLLPLPSKKRVLNMRSVQKAIRWELKASKILPSDGGTVNVHEAPFSRHQDLEKGHVVMACHLAIGAISEGEPTKAQWFNGYKNSFNTNF